MYNTIEVGIDAVGVATLTLCRPEKHNALSGEMIDDVFTAVTALDADDSVRVVVLRGAGRSFCAGGDLAWMKAQINATAEVRAASARRLAAMLGAVNSLSKPVIAVIQGAAFGGGVGLACVADKVIASEAATFGLTETKLGLIPATIGPYVIARMGEGAARQVFMSSRPFDARTAQRLGIVAEVVAPDDLDTALAAEVAAYLACAPAAVAEAKAMVLSLGHAPDSAAVAASVAALLARWEHPEATAGITAFFDKTTPPWAVGDVTKSAK